MRLIQISRPLAGLVLVMAASLLVWPSSASLAEPEASQQEHIRLIDYEILLLRAEIALRNAQRGLFLQYMQQLGQQKTPPQFVARLEQLRQQLAQIDVREDAEVVQIGFDTANKAQNIVILLPLSSAYAEAGQAILEPIQQAYADRRVYVLDSDLYEDMTELWELVKLFSPDLIIGPLERNKAEAFYAQNVQTPSVIFTSIQAHYPYLRSLAPSAVSYLKGLEPLLTEVDWHRIGWVTDSSPLSEDFVVELAAFYSAQGIDDSVVRTEPLQAGVDRTLSRLFGVEQSNARKNWLQRTLGRQLEFDAYVRADKRLVVAFLSHQQAIQLSPLLDYYGRNLPVIWVPSQLPEMRMFKASLDSWQSTHALLPSHFVFEYRQPDQKSDENINVGLFHAMGEMTIEMVRRSAQGLDGVQPEPFVTKLGLVQLTERGQYYFLPELFELKQGRVNRASFENLMP